MNVTSIPCLNDNYCYAVVPEKSKSALVVDASEAAPIIQYLRSNSLYLSTILLTHGHHDHIQGLDALLQKFPETKVYGHPLLASSIENFERVQDKTSIEIDGFSVRTIFTECHSNTDVCFYLEDGAKSILFSGDTLFSAGCGRFFHGTAEDMCRALEKLCEFPEQTEIYFGHEYTASNLKFAESIEPGNKTIKKKLAAIKAEGGGTTPAVLSEELEINPFLRLDNQEVRSRLGRELSTKVERMGELRKLKNQFKA